MHVGRNYAHCTLARGIILLPAFLAVCSALWAYEQPKLMQAPVASYPSPLGTLFDSGYIRPHAGDMPQLALPSRFDWRDSGKVTPVKNQGICGACWAFGFLGDLESDVLAKEQRTVDLSEQVLVSCATTAQGCGGGSAVDAANHLTLKGIVYEADFPYTGSQVPCGGPYVYRQNVTEWHMLSGETQPTDITPLKTAISNYGPMITTMYADSQFDSYRSGVIYLPGNYGTNHYVLVVGWDDNMAHAGGTGAWICKNSWGTNWGQQGYFYVAYGSASMGTYASCVAAYQPANPDRRLLAYDESGWRTSYGYGNNTACAAVRFTPPVSGVLRAVEFWAVDRLTSYTVEVYDSFNGVNMSSLLAQASGSCPDSGYYSVPLTTPVPVTAGDEITIKMKFVTAGFIYPIPADSNPPTVTGKCYISYTGGNGTWQDAGPSADVGIRARIEPDYRLTMAVSPSGAGTTNPTQGSYQYGWSTVVPISAAPAGGYIFDHWDGVVADSWSASTTVTIDATRTVTAVFVPAPSLTISTDPSVGGTTSPAPGTYPYLSTTTVTVQALPKVGSVFRSWLGGVASPNSATTTITVNGPKSITAVFGPDIPTAKKAAETTPVGISHAVVTGAFTNGFYVEMANRCSGLWIRKIGHGMLAGDVANISGTMAVGTDGEKYVSASSVARDGTLTVPKPLGLNIRGLGGGNWFYSLSGKLGQSGSGVGLNNIGLLVRCWGTSTGRNGTAGTFYLSGSTDTSVGPLVKVIMPPGTGVPADGSLLRVTGICSLSGSTDGTPRILVRTSTDVVNAN